MTDSADSASARRTYTKPSITLVELVTNEAVFENCKLSTRSSGPDNYNSRCQSSVYGYTVRCQEYLS